MDAINLHWALTSAKIRPFGSLGFVVSSRSSQFQRRLYSQVHSGMRQFWAQTMKPITSLALRRRGRYGDLQAMSRKRFSSDPVCKSKRRALKTFTYWGYHIERGYYLSGVQRVNSCNVYIRHFLLRFANWFATIVTLGMAVPLESSSQTWGLYCGYTGIMENGMKTTVRGLGFRHST